MLGHQKELLAVGDQYDAARGRKEKGNVWKNGPSNTFPDVLNIIMHKLYSFCSVKEPITIALEVKPRVQPKDKKKSTKDREKAGSYNYYSYVKMAFN